MATLKEVLAELDHMHDRQGALLREYVDAVKSIKISKQHGMYYYLDVSSRRDGLMVLVKVENDNPDVVCGGNIKRIKSYCALRNITQEMIVDLRKDKTPD